MARVNRRSPGAFSLIELLVVVSIVAVLFAVILPSLGQARAVAISMRCLANQKQFMPALMSYATDHKQFMPIGVRAPDIDKRTANHAGVIAHYTNTVYFTEWSFNTAAYPENAKALSATSETRNKRYNHILKCPGETFLNTWGTFTAVSYGWNSGVWGVGNSDHFFDTESRRRIRMSEIEKPFNTVLTGDWLDRNGLNEYHYYDQFTWNTTETRPNLSTYHMGGGNALWADGRATQEKRNSMIPEHFDRRY